MVERMDRHSAQFKEMAELLRSHGVLPTRQRLEVAQAMLSEPQHLTPDQLLKRVNRDFPAASRATIYNTLAAFVRAGLVGVVNVDGGTVYYDSTTSGHAHVYNEDTGELTDADIDVMRLAGQVPLPDDVQPVDVDFVVRVRRKDPV